MTTSRIPATIDALVSRWTAAAALAGVAVLDGPPTIDLPTDFLTVGWSPYADVAVDGTQAFAAIGGNAPRDEDFTIACYADSYTGDTDPSARRSRVYQLVAAAESDLRTDPTLGGVLTLWAEIVAQTLHQEQTDRGLVVGVTFHVHCRTRI